MTLQSTVAQFMGFGVVGEVFLDGVYRAQPGQITSVGTTNPNRIGRMFTKGTNDGDATVGGTGAIMGILMNPKVYPALGTVAGGTLAPTLDMPQYAEAEFCYMSTGLIVKLENAGLVGDTVDYDTTTGQLYARTFNASGGAGTAAVASNVMTIAALPAGSPPIGIGSVITTASGKQGTVTGLGTGTGGNGTYQTVGLPDHAAEAFTYTSVPASGRANIPRSHVQRYSTTQAGNAVVELNG